MRELDGEWRKATRSGQTGGCVKVRRGPSGMIQVGHSREGEGQVVKEYTDLEWAAFLDGVKNGEFEI